MSLFETLSVRLRVPEPEDVDILYKWENDTEIWGVSNTLIPFSKSTILQFIDNQSRDIFETRQARFIIESIADGKAVGAIDLYDYDPLNRRAGVGILIYGDQNRNKGYATEAIEIVVRYSFGVLQLHQLYCDIPSDNTASIRLFAKCGFTSNGCRKEWMRDINGWHDVEMMQLLEGSR